LRGTLKRTAILTKNRIQDKQCGRKYRLNSGYNHQAVKAGMKAEEEYSRGCLDGASSVGEQCPGRIGNGLTILFGALGDRGNIRQVSERHKTGRLKRKRFYSFQTSAAVRGIEDASKPVF
jgi:hypothetical protein